MKNEQWRLLLENEVRMKTRLENQLNDMRKELRLAGFFEFSKKRNLRAMIENKRHEVNVADQHNTGMVRAYLAQVKLETKEIEVTV
jgi:hypothetical protein